MKFGEKLRQLRLEKKLTQPELAEAMGIEQSYLSKLENCKSLPSNDVLHRILDVFNLELVAYTLIQIIHQSRLSLIISIVRSRRSSATAGGGYWFQQRCFPWALLSFTAGGLSCLHPMSCINTRLTVSCRTVSRRRCFECCRRKGSPLDR